MVWVLMPQSVVEIPIRSQDDGTQASGLLDNNRII